MNRYEIIQKIGDMYQIGNTESGEFSYVQALKTVGEKYKRLPKMRHIYNPSISRHKIRK